jgi:Tfp pilus assembly protein PilN
MQSQRVDLARLLSVLFFVVFLILSAFNIGYTTLNLMQVRQDLTAATGEQISVRDQSVSLAAAIKKMQELKTRVVAYLEFTRAELPAVEFMKALEDAVPQGLKIATLEVREGNVLMRGSAVSDEEIITLASNLANLSYIVKKVDAPVTTKSTLGSRLISDFAVTCDIKAILDVAAEDPNQQPFASPTPSEEANEGGGGQ